MNLTNATAPLPTPAGPLWSADKSKGTKNPKQPTTYVVFTMETVLVSSY
jgi:hypothetical protein